MRDSSVFEIIGPIMIGPSSSHTAGALRIAQLARVMAGEPIKEVEFTLYGSFSKTYGGHGTDRALVAGILGFTTSDYRIRDSLQIAKEEGLKVSFEISDDEISGTMHPNTVDIRMVTASGKVTTVRGASIGGGQVEIVRFNGAPVRFSGESNVLAIEGGNHVGTLASVCDLLREANVNITNLRTYKEEREHFSMFMVEIDGRISEEGVEQLRALSNIDSVNYIQVK